MLLAGKVAIVTGAGRGIGRAIASALAAEGAAVIVNDFGVDMNGQQPDAGPAETAVQEITAAGGQAIAHCGSVADEKDVDGLVDLAIRNFGTIDILVNNAGIIIRNLIVDTPAEDWDRQVAVHMRGSFLTARAVIPEMTRRKQGRIINFTSASGLYSYPGSNAYTTAKGGILSFTRLLAQELIFDNITVNAIAPGADTRMVDGNPESVVALRKSLGIATRSHVPIQERVPEAVAAGVAYLASDEAAFVNGQVIGVSGSRLDLWGPPVILQSAFNDKPWTLADLREKFPRTIGRDLAAKGQTS